jgi:hypothetical protein
MQIPKTTAANAQPSFKIQKIVDWMHSLDETTPLENAQPKQETITSMSSARQVKESHLISHNFLQQRSRIIPCNLVKLQCSWTKPSTKFLL